MKHLCTSFLIVFLFTGSLSAQNGLPRAASGNGTGPVSASPQDGNGELNNMFNVKKCGLNYVSASKKVTTRTPLGGPGSDLPVTLTISGIPATPCLKIEKAYVWYELSYYAGSPIAPDVRVTNPLGTLSTFKAAIVGTDGEKCWGEIGTRTFRTDVTAAISGDGNYTFDIATPSNEMDGITFMVIYSDPTAAYSGTLVIADGIISVNAAIQFSEATLDGFSACEDAVIARAFAAVGDYQLDGHATTLNGVPVAFPDFFWNYDEVNTVVTNGQTTAEFGTMPTTGIDCYSWILMGLYYQETSCATCPLPPFTLDSIISTPATCGNNNGTASVKPAGPDYSPYSYLWNTVPVQTTQTATGLAAGIYKVVVSDATGCIKDSAEVTVGNSNGPTAAMFIQDVSCFGYSDGEAIVNPTGSTSYTYSWNTVPEQTTQVATGLAKGTYTVTITDNNNCVIMENAVIGEPDPLQITTSSTDVSCNGLSDGSASVGTPTGGTPPYTYSWNTMTPQTSQIATGLSKGTYTVTVTDDNNCSVSADVTVDEPDPLQFSTGKTDISCNGFDDGSANVASVSGGTPPYSYSWNTSPQQSTTAVSGLTPGTYTVTVSDDNGCSETQDVTITEPSAFSVSINGIASLCSGENGTLSAVASGGTGPFSYTWTPDIGTGAGPHTISLLTGLAYHVDVTDMGTAGCSSSADYTIVETDCYHFYIPNAFSPNGDGNNDLFQPTGRGITVYSMGIFNRWGEKVFETKQLTEGWKGDLKGTSLTEAPTGVYIYIIKANDSEGAIKTYQGTVSLTK